MEGENIKVKKKKENKREQKEKNGILKSIWKEKHYRYEEKKQEGG